MSTNLTSPSGSPPAVQLMRSLGMEPDPWQIEVLEGGHSRLLLNCCRQAGKSTVVALLALAEALFVPGTQILILSRSQRQSTELFRVVLQFYGQLGWPYQKRQVAHELELQNLSRIVCLPCNESTIRGYSSIGFLIIDEAAGVSDDRRSEKPVDEHNHALAANGSAFSATRRPSRICSTS